MTPSDDLLSRAEFPQVLDSSILSTSSCGIKFFYQYCLNLHPQRKSIHLHAGGAFAKGVETVRRSFYLEQKPLDVSVYDGWRSLTDYWGTYDDVPAEGSGSYKDFYNVSAALFDYFRHYDPRSDHIQPYIKSDGTPAVEFTFAIPLPILHPDTDEPLVYAGRCDMIGQYQKNIAIVDEKTAYSIASNWSNAFTMRGQFIGYTWAARHFEIPANMCIVRGIAIQQKSIKHVEAILQFPNHLIENWYENMLEKVERLKNCWINKSFPMNFGTDCSSYGGCSMMDLCKSAKPDNWIDTFEVRKWNPLDLSNIKDGSASE